MTDLQGKRRYQSWTVSVLRLVSMSPAEQQEYARSTGVGVDEIALQLDDVHRVSQARLRRGLLTDQEFSWVDRVSGMADELGASSANPWSEEAVFNLPKWAELRSVAAEAIAALDELRSADWEE